MSLILLGCSPEEKTDEADEAADDSTNTEQSVPSQGAISVVFTDTDLDAGEVSGTVSISRASDESDITHYVIYWGDDSLAKLEGLNEIATLEAIGSDLSYSIGGDTVLPAGAVYFLVYTKNDHGERATGIGTLISDRWLPTQSAVSVYFTATDLDSGEVGGIVNISRASDETDITHYVIYWGNESLSKLEGQDEIISLEVTGTDLSHTISDNTALPAGATHILVFTKNEYGEMTTGVYAPIDQDPNPALEQALDNLSLTWTTGGDASWDVSSDSSLFTESPNLLGAMSGNIAHNQQSWLETTVSGSGTLTFFWKVTSEDGYDLLAFYIDGVLQQEISGNTSWEQKSYAIQSEGVHTLKWSYSKDDSNSTGDDRGYLDNVQYSTQAPLKLLVIRINFSDYTFQSSAGIWSAKFFGSSAGQLNHYLSEISYNKFTFDPAEETEGTINDGIVTVTLTKNHPNPGADGAFQQELVDAITLADPYVDFSSFDSSSDQTLVSGELQVMFLVAGYESATGASPGVWAHAHCIDSVWEGVSAPVLDGVQVLGCFGNGYSRFGEKHDQSQNNDATIGIIAHELGHSTFFLPDLYDLDTSSAGIGTWGLMDNGSWGYQSGEFPGETPVHMTAWSKIKVGWVTPTLVSSTANGIQLQSTNQSDYNVIKLLTENSGEYFLLENRGISGYERGLYSMEETSFLGGLAIWHIDDNMTSNNDETHKHVDLEEAAEIGLDTNIHYGKRANLYYNGNVTTFNDSTTPDSKTYSGTSSGIEVNSVSAAGDNMTVDIVK